MSTNKRTNIASEDKYRRVFNYQFNIEFHKPKKDLCDECTAFRYLPEDQKLLRQAEYNIHIKNKLRAKELMDLDKEEALTNKSICAASFDVEKTLTTPRSNVSMMYYKRKLNVYNFTIYNLVTHEGICYLWNETIGGKGANEIASCLWRFIKLNVDNGVKEFRFYSDNCGAQNRNKSLFSMYARAVKKYNIVIIHRYIIILLTNNVKKAMGKFTRCKIIILH